MESETAGQGARPKVSQRKSETCNSRPTHRRAISAVKSETSEAGEYWLPTLRRHWLPRFRRPGAASRRPWKSPRRGPTARADVGGQQSIRLRHGARSRPCGLNLPGSPWCKPSPASQRCSLLAPSHNERHRSEQKTLCLLVQRCSSTRPASSPTPMPTLGSSCFDVSIHSKTNSTPFWIAASAAAQAIIIGSPGALRYRCQPPARPCAACRCHPDYFRVDPDIRCKRAPREGLRPVAQRKDDVAAVTSN
jgi:hypothetical protein